MSGVALGQTAIANVVSALVAVVGTLVGCIVGRLAYEANKAWKLRQEIRDQRRWAAEWSARMKDGRNAS